MISINDDVAIPDDELSFVASRSRGPGGQNVNKVNSRVTLLFDVRGSRSLSDEQKARIEERLGKRVNDEGVLQVSSQSERSQLANRTLAIERFIALVRGALKQQKPRKKSRVSAAAKARRVDEKKRHALKKQHRRIID